MGAGEGAGDGAGDGAAVATGAAPDFDRDLVGLEAGDGLIERHRFAGLLEPLADGGFTDRFAEGGNFDFRGHVRVIQKRRGGGDG